MDSLATAESKKFVIFSSLKSNFRAATPALKKWTICLSIGMPPEIWKTKRRQLWKINELDECEA